MSKMQKKWLPSRHEISTTQLRDDIVKGKFKDDDYIKGRFINAVSYFEKLEHQDSFRYTIFQIILIGFSALATFTVALEGIIASSTALKIIALLLTLFVAILANYLTTFNFQAKWGAYRFTRESLTAEFYKLDLGIDPYSDSDDKTVRKNFVINVEKMIENANKVWGGLHLSGSQPGQQPAQTMSKV